MAKGKAVVFTDKTIREACQDIRYKVEHPNEDSDIIMQQGVYKQKDPRRALTAKLDGVVIGYQVIDPCPLEINPVMIRNVFVKFPGYTIKEIPDHQLKPIMFAIFEEMFDQQQGEIKVSQTDRDTIKLTQTFMISMIVNKNPNLVSKVGGFSA